MTVIACDGRTMAADSCCSGDGMIHNDSTIKIKHLADGRVFGATGDIYTFVQAAAALDKGETIDLMADGFEGLILDHTGKCWSMDRYCRIAPVSVPVAAGGGSHAAMAVMLAGHSATFAAEIAARFIVSCGGPIITLAPREVAA